jgi:calcium/calmodulin-dependent protein kinase I
MGSCMSGFAPQHLLDVVDGNEEEYQKRFLEENVLGEGEFGIVKLVQDMQLKKQRMMNPTGGATSTNNNHDNNEEPQPYACKILQKGVVFKDNVLYTPLKPEVLRGEIDMLRTLAGNYYCLKLHAVYESNKRLYIVTECCMGGTMTQYVSAQGTTFTIDDVSRISYQLLSAIDHCVRYQILHRDIKPDNVMFTHLRPGADIRLIDFGSGCMDSKRDLSASSSSTVPSKVKGTQPVKDVEFVNGLRVHTTYAGSAFYISPELFNHSYTSMTDIWSVGVTLYVLVAGYPSDVLQKVFNILQCNKRDIHTLPNIPNDIPESFYELLNGCLTYKYQERPGAKKLLQYEFVTLHQQKQDDPAMDEEQVTTDSVSDFVIGDYDDDDEIVTDTTTTPVRSKRRTASISLAGTVVRHNLFLNFQQYERSLTTLLATLLSKSELEQLLFVLNKRVKVLIEEPQVGASSEPTKTNTTTTMKSDNFKEQQLAVVPIFELKSILRDDLLKDDLYVLLQFP